MSSVSTIHTLVPNATIPLGYFDEENIQFIQNKIVEVLQREFYQKVQVDRGSIIRVMERALLDLIEPVPKMNQRVIMYITNEYRNHQFEANKHMRWEGLYVLSQRMYDPTAESQRFDAQSVKLNADFRGQKVGGTLRFYFT